MNMTERVLRAESGCRCGESHQRAKLSDEDVELARKWREDGMPTPLDGKKIRVTIQQLADAFEQPYDTMCSIVHLRRRNTRPDFEKSRVR